MKIRVHQNHWLPIRLKRDAITLYPFILLYSGAEAATKDYVLSHEWLHVLQVRRLGWLKFYASYVWSYIKGRWSGLTADAAYRAIPFEIEAYEKQFVQVVPLNEIVFK